MFIKIYYTALCKKLSDRGLDRKRDRDAIPSSDGGKKHFGERKKSNRDRQISALNLVREERGDDLAQGVVLFLFSEIKLRGENALGSRAL